MTPRMQQIQDALEAALAPESIELVDESHLHAGHAGARSGGGHYDLTIVAECFRNQNSVARHRLVYDALKEAMGSDIHALSIKAFSPDEI
jgi:BolA family transcriptional regulator, general stress-responsive regulator